MKTHRARFPEPSGMALKPRAYEADAGDPRAAAALRLPGHTAGPAKRPGAAIAPTVSGADAEERKPRHFAPAVLEGRC
jgi:hypothetical protein